METGSLVAEIRRLRQLKADLKWNDDVGASFDAWFDKLEYATENTERVLAALDSKVREITVRASLNELEDMYSALLKSYAEAEG